MVFIVRVRKSKSIHMTNLVCFRKAPLTACRRPVQKGSATDARQVEVGRDKEISQYEKVMQALQHEASLIGKTKLEQEILNNIRRAGVDVMSDEANQIRAQITANDALTQSIEAQAAAQEALQRQIEGMTSVAMSHYDAMIDGTESFGDAVLGTIEDIARAWLRQQAQQGLNALFGALMGGLTGGGGLPMPIARAPTAV